MAELKELKQQLVDYLSDHFSGQGVAVMGEFPPSPKPSPLLKSRIAVGFDAMAVQDAGLDDYPGEDSSQTLRGRYVQITLRFDLACPVRLGGGACQGLFEDLLDALLLRRNSLGVEELTCGPVAYDKNIGGFLLCAKGRMNALISAGETSLAIDEIELRRVME